MWCNFSSVCQSFYTLVDYNVTSSWFFPCVFDNSLAIQNLNGHFLRKETKANISDKESGNFERWVNGWIGG